MKEADILQAAHDEEMAKELFRGPFGPVGPTWEEWEQGQDWDLSKMFQELGAEAEFRDEDCIDEDYEDYEDEMTLEDSWF